jgi:iron complex outermembrane receptor protein
MSANSACNSRRFNRLHLRLLASAALFIPAAGHAEQTPPQNDSTSQPSDQNNEGIKTTRTEQGEIVVTARHYVPQGAQTATKSDIPLIQTPQSISVITRDQIDLLNFTDAQQAVRYTAGAFGEY